MKFIAITSVNCLWFLFYNWGIYDSRKYFQSWATSHMLSCSLLLSFVYLAIFIGWQVKSATLVFWKASNADIENQMKISLHH